MLALNSTQVVHTQKVDDGRFNLPLKAKDMPASLAGQALLFGARSHLLNPPNLGQDRVSRMLGKPIRFIARLIYGLVVNFLASVLGVAYHAGAAAVNGIKELKAHLMKDTKQQAYYHEMAMAHFEAFRGDLVGALSLGLLAPPGEYGAYNILAYASDSKDIARITACYFNDRRVSHEEHSNVQKIVFNELVERY